MNFVVEHQIEIFVLYIVLDTFGTRIFFQHWHKTYFERKTKLWNFRNFRNFGAPEFICRTSACYCDSIYLATYIIRDDFCFGFRHDEIWSEIIWSHDINAFKTDIDEDSWRLATFLTYYIDKKPDLWFKWFCIIINDTTYLLMVVCGTMQ